jgi:hypothetical protein
MSHTWVFYLFTSHFLSPFVLSDSASGIGSQAQALSVLQCDPEPLCLQAGAGGGHGCEPHEPWRLNRLPNSVSLCLDLTSSLSPLGTGAQHTVPEDTNYVD